MGKILVGISKNLERIDVMNHFLNRLSIKNRLIVFSSSALALIFLVVFALYFFYQRVDVANENIQRGLRLGEDIQKMRVTQNQYMKYYDAALIDKFTSLAKKTEQPIHSLLNEVNEAEIEQINTLQIDIQNFISAFDKIVIEHVAFTEADGKIHRISSEMNKAIKAIIRQIEGHESDLQMEGEELRADESEMMNVARDIDILYLNFENQRKEYAITGQEKIYENTIKQILSEDVHFQMVAVEEFAAALNDSNIINHAKKLLSEFSKYKTIYSDLHAVKVEEGRYATQLDDLSIIVSDRVEAFIDTLNDAVATIKKLAYTFVLGFLVVIVILFVLTTYSFIKTVTRSIHILSRSVEAVGRGDFTTEIRIEGNNELTFITKEFKNTVESLKKLIQEITDNARELDESSSHLSTVSGNLSSGSESMVNQSTEVAASGEEASNNVTNISGSMQSMTESINIVSASIEEMSSAIGEISTKCQDEMKMTVSAKEKASSTKDVMEKLNASANKVSKVVGIINSIASQTNLLALNATIEAASAGEAGKGFAVVANEVKELAKQTSDATSEIELQINEMLSNTQVSISAIEEIDTISEEVSNISQSIAASIEEQSVTTNEISSNLNEVSNLSTSVADNVKSAAEKLHGVSTSIHHVNDTIDVSAAEIKAVNENADKLNGIAADLISKVDHFKV